MVTPPNPRDGTSADCAASAGQKASEVGYFTTKSEGHVMINLLKRGGLDGKKNGGNFVMS
jgi:hypothetical protein